MGKNSLWVQLHIGESEVRDKWKKQFIFLKKIRNLVENACVTAEGANYIC